MSISRRRNVLTKTGANGVAAPASGARIFGQAALRWRDAAEPLKRQPQASDRADRASPRKPSEDYEMFCV
jgi:hypothetical protein